MNNFTLSRPQDKVLPVKLKDSSGGHYAIDANFRTVLKIFRIFDDNDVMERQKLALIVRWFYTDTVPTDVVEAITMMNDFIHRKHGEPEPKRGKAPAKQFDYEFDAEEIYVSFLTDYNIDLLAIDFLHWHKFQILLMNLSADSAFSQKIRLRFMDLKNYKGEQHAKMSRAKRKVQLPVKYSQEEEIAIKEMLEKLRR